MPKRKRVSNHLTFLHYHACNNVPVPAHLEHHTCTLLTSSYHTYQVSKADARVASIAKMVAEAAEGPPPASQSASEFFFSWGGDTFAKEVVGVIDGATSAAAVEEVEEEEEKNVEAEEEIVKDEEQGEESEQWEEGEEGDEGDEGEEAEDEEDAAVDAAFFGEDMQDGEEGDEVVSEYQHFQDSIANDGEGDEGDEGEEVAPLSARVSPQDMELYGPLLDKALEEVDDIDNGGFRLGGDGRGNNWAGKNIKLDDDDEGGAAPSVLPGGDGGFATAALASLTRLASVEHRARVLPRLAALDPIEREQLEALLLILSSDRTESGEGGGDDESDEEEGDEEEEEEEKQAEEAEEAEEAVEDDEDDEGPEETAVSKHPVPALDWVQDDPSQGSEEGGEGEGDGDGDGEGDEEIDDDDQWTGEGDECQGEGDFEEEEWVPRQRTKEQRIAYDSAHLGTLAPFVRAPLVIALVPECPPIAHLFLPLLGRLKELYGPLIEKHLEVRGRWWHKLW
jgi:hypothetical protein